MFFRGSEIHLFRCCDCHGLLPYHQIQKKGSCNCGGRRVKGASPKGIIEYVKCYWWSLTLK